MRGIAALAHRVLSRGGTADRTGLRPRQTRTRALAYLGGLLSPAERKNGWPLAEIIGEATPYGVQYLLGRTEWDPDELRDRLRTCVADSLVAADAVGVLDETGFLKTARSVGGARQSCGAAGRVENCQIGVVPTYASVHGHTLLDRGLYPPASWIDDPERCRQASIPADRPFATKPEMARQLLERDFAAGVTFAAIASDSVYGDDRPLRPWLEAQRQPYVLAIAPVEQLRVGHASCTHAELLARLADVPWERHSRGDGSQGPRWYDWQRLALNDPPQAGFQRWGVFRRNWTNPTEVTA